MSDDLKLVTVPRDLYYHEIAYVRGLEADNERLQELLRGIGANRYWEGRWRDGTAEIERLRALLTETVASMERRGGYRTDLQKRIRAALEHKP